MPQRTNTAILADRIIRGLLTILENAEAPPDARAEAGKALAQLIGPVRPGVIDILDSFEQRKD
jgi:hypothetical protein